MPSIAYPVSRAHSQRLRLMLMLLGAAACQPAVLPPGEWNLTSVQPVRDLLPVAGAQVLLVFDPVDCLSCSFPVFGWLHWRRRHHDAESVGVVLRRAGYCRAVLPRSAR